MKLLNNDLKQALVIDPVYGTDLYDVDSSNEVLYYKEFNKRYRLSRSNRKRIWLSGCISKKDLNFCIMQAISIATKNTHYVDYLGKSTFSEIQKICIQEKNIEYSSILLSPQWNKHISYIMEKLPKHKTECTEYRFFFDENIEVNEIYLTPPSQFLGTIKGVGDSFNLMVYNGSIMHRIMINRFPYTVEKYFEKMMEEALS